jgi:phosphoribosyl 1,2-cyclic phosphate phosphodiesterase
MSLSLTFLGTGTSVGVPQIGCSCKVCTSKDPRDRRNRCGAYVRAGETGFLIDTPPEMRLACCRLGVTKVDAVVLTHAHMDHVAGFDDVRRFNTLNGTWVPCDPNEDGANGRTQRCLGKVMPCYAMKETEEQMHRIFPYITAKGGEHGLFRPMIEFHNDDAFTVGDVRVERLAVEHGFPCCGYLMRAGAGSKGIAYISDCHVLPEATLAKLAGVDTFVLNCLRERVHPTHLSLAQCLAYIRQIAPRRAFLIHMCHDFLHTEWLEKLPRGVEPAYDGLTISVD